jgi:sortase A
VAGKAFGTIEIPRLGLNVPLLSGITDTVLDRGPGHWPGTALPGQVGNVVVAGHRVSHTRPFRYIDQLQIGDEIIYTTAAGRFRYRVSETFIVTPQQVEIVRQSDAYETTLFACHPPGSIKYRYVVRAVLAP